MSSRHPDYILIGIIAVLTSFGLLMIASASIGLSQDEYQQSYYFLKNQLTHGLLPGLLLGLAAYFIPYRFWRRLALPMFIFTLLLLVLVLVPGLGLTHGGAKRWLHLGSFAPQPSEILKLTFIIYLAAWFAAKRQDLKNFLAGALPFVIILGSVSVLLALEPDIGTLGVVFFTALAIYFLAGTKPSHLALISVAALALFGLLIKLFSHASKRLQVFLHPELDPHGVGYQIQQAMLALGSGGIFGLGLGQSLQKFRYLPEPTGDSIAAVIGEELGLAGLCFVVALFIIFMIRALKITKNAPDDFSKLLAGGITAWITIQALINMAAVSGLIPLTGIPLPFISLGGSSLTVTLIAMGILLNISKYSTK